MSDTTVRFSRDNFRRLVRQGKQPTVEKALADRDAFVCPECLAVTRVAVAVEFDPECDEQATVEHDCGWSREYTPEDLPKTIGSDRVEAVSDGVALTEKEVERVYKLRSLSNRTQSRLCSAATTLGGGRIPDSCPFCRAVDPEWQAAGRREDGSVVTESAEYVCSVCDGDIAEYFPGTVAHYLDETSHE